MIMYTGWSQSCVTLVQLSEGGGHIKKIKKNTLSLYMCIGNFHSVWIMENIWRIMEKSWNNHGISFSEMAGNPERF